MESLERIRGNASEADSLFNLACNQLGRRIKRAALEAGLGEGFSGHSPRVGMAQDLARAGIELPRLMTAGRWRSPRMPALYTRNEMLAKGAVAEFYGFYADYPRTHAGNFTKGRMSLRTGDAGLGFQLGDFDRMNLVHKDSDNTPIPIGPKTAILNPIDFGADIFTRFPLLPPILRTSDVNDGLYRLLLV